MNKETIKTVGIVALIIIILYLILILSIARNIINDQIETVNYYKENYNICNENLIETIEQNIEK